MNITNALLIPKITVLIPIFNAELFLIESIQSILNQTFTDFELLAINDGSTDSSSEILSSFNDKRLRIINNDKNRGLIYTLNKGVEEAQGQYIARMDADDVATPDRLEKQLNFLLQYPDTILVGSNIELIDENGIHIGYRSYPEHHNQIILQLETSSPFAHPAVMFNKSKVIDVSGYRKQYIACEDYDLWLRLSNQGQCANIQENLLQYRIHSEQITARNLRLQHFSHIKARNEALGLADYSLLQKIRGIEGTLGSKYLSLAYQQKQLSNRLMSTKLCLISLLHAPLNRNSWNFLKGIIKSTKTYDLIIYYKKRTLSLLINK